MSARSLVDRIEDVAWLAEQGESAQSICERLNTTAAALSRLLYRHKRPELARPFEAIVRQQRPNKHRSHDRRTFPRYDNTVRAWALANGQPLDDRKRVTKATFDAWQQTTRSAA